MEPLLVNSNDPMSEMFSFREKIINSGICVIVDSDCISGIGNFLRNILFPFLPNKDCASIRYVTVPLSFHLSVRLSVTELRKESLSVPVDYKLV